MKKDRTIFIEDIFEAIEKIRTYTKGVSFNKFLKHSMIQDAVERKIIIIGEAFSRYKYSASEDDPKFPYIQAISMKNFLVHEYEKVDPKEVWKTVKKDIPDLEKKIKKLLDK